MIFEVIITTLWRESPTADPVEAAGNQNGDRTESFWHIDIVCWEPEWA